MASNLENFSPEKGLIALGSSRGGVDVVDMTKMSRIMSLKDVHSIAITGKVLESMILIVRYIFFV